MHELSGIKLDDWPARERGGEAGVDLTHLLGLWINTCRETHSLDRFTLSRGEAGETIETVAVTGGGNRDLGRAAVTPFSAHVDSRKADGFTARYDFGFLEMTLAAYFVKGLIVVSQYTRFQDGSGRPDYFNREFFFREEA